MEAKAPYQQPRPKVVTDTIKRMWGNLPIVDAKEPLVISVEQEDIESAVPQDPENCALSQACKRLYESRYVMFLRSKAYIDLPTRTGKRQIERFTLSQETSEAIKIFDLTGKSPEAGFKLLAPSPTDRLGARSAEIKHRNERGAYGPRRDPLTLAGVRNGSGAPMKFIKYTPTKSGAK
jgi:hypothetical protein